jgi:hypothetical protein
LETDPLTLVRGTSAIAKRSRAREAPLIGLSDERQGISFPDSYPTSKIDLAPPHVAPAPPLACQPSSPAARHHLPDCEDLSVHGPYARTAVHHSIPDQGPRLAWRRRRPPPRSTSAFTSPMIVKSPPAHGPYAHPTGRHSNPDPGDGCHLLRLLLRHGGRNTQGAAQRPRV